MEQKHLTLAQWRAREKVSQEWLASELGVPRTSLSGYENGSRAIPVPMAVLIQEVTKGAVTLVSWWPEVGRVAYMIPEPVKAFPKFRSEGDDE